MYDSNSDCNAVDCLLLILITSFVQLCFHYYSFQCILSSVRLHQHTSAYCCQRNDRNDLFIYESSVDLSFAVVRQINEICLCLDNCPANLATQPKSSRNVQYKCKWISGPMNVADYVLCIIFEQQLCFNCRIINNAAK